MILMRRRRVQPREIMGFSAQTGFESYPYCLLVYDLRIGLNFHMVSVFPVENWEYEISPIGLLRGFRELLQVTRQLF